MMISKETTVKIGTLNYKHYEKLGYKFKNGDIILVKVEDLTKGSHAIIEYGCDYCNKSIFMPYKRYLKGIININKYSCSDKNCSNKKIQEVCNVKYNVNNPFQLESVKIKSKETIWKKYGKEHPMYSKEIKLKIKSTCIQKYGVDNYTKTQEYLNKCKKTSIDKYGIDHESKTKEGQEKRKITRIKKGKQLPDDKIDKFLLYRRKVNNLTNKYKKELFENWNGYDYYSNEYIKENFNNKNFGLHPSIDHKISVYYGFLNNVNPDIIANINNLCITTISNNSTKSTK